MITDVDISIPIPPFVDNPFGFEKVGLSHKQEGDAITFEIPSHLIWMAEITGIRITYTEAP